MTTPSRTAAMMLLMLSCAGAAAQSSTYIRSGSDRIAVASLPGIGDVTPSYDATYGYVTLLDGDTYSLSYEHDPFSGKLLTQTLTQTSSQNVKTILLNANNTYDALDRRIHRGVDAGQMSSAAGSSDYWYGPMLLKPMVASRSIGDLSETARIIYLGNQPLAIEAVAGTPVASYPVTDHLGSTRATLDSTGAVQSSLSYDDWGQTTIVGQPSAVGDVYLNTLFRFQGIEQDLFPLTKLGMFKAEALAWLDAIVQYHYYGREYAAGLASFLAPDPAGSSVSPYSAFAANPANYVDPDGMAVKRASDSLQAFVKHMRKSGIQKIFLVEMHNMDGDQPYNIDVVSRVLTGALAVGPLKFWREMAIPDEYVRNITAKAMALFEEQQQEYVVPHLAQNFFRTTDTSSGKFKTSAAYMKFQKAVLKKGIALAPMFFADPQYQDLTDFINYPGFSVASMGGTHAEFNHAGEMNMLMPWGNKK